jgi:hypothetical protein
MFPAGRCAYISFVVLVAMVCTSGTAQAARARFHYAATDSCGRMSLKPGGPCGAVGERLSLFGAAIEPLCAPPLPTHYLSFRHPCTGQTVTVPVCLPEGTPRLEYRNDRVIYNYGSYTVEVHFLADGSVDVVYNSGILRDL